MKGRIFTHSGIFHADDCFAVAAALILLPEAEVIRVRQLPEDFDSEYDIALDVGGQHDIDRMIFDHHQENGNDDGCAAVGKFWKWGYKIIIDTLYPDLSEYLLNNISEYVENSIINPIDRGDIGLKDWEPTEDAIENGWSHLSAARLISSCNAPFGSSEEVQMEHFITCVRMADLSLRGTIRQGIEFCWMKFEVAKAAENRSLDSIKHHYLVLEEPGPWQSHILGREDLEDVLYVIFPSDRGGWMVQCVPDALDSFGMRKPLPKHWAGLRGKLFASITDLEQHGSATFCHPGRFIAGAENLEEAKILAVLAAKN